MLDRISATDSYYLAESGFYPYRIQAKFAADSIRERLAVGQNKPKQ